MALFEVVQRFDVIEKKAEDWDRGTNQKDSLQYFKSWIYPYYPIRG